MSPTFVDGKGVCGDYCQNCLINDPYYDRLKPSAADAWTIGWGNCVCRGVSQGGDWDINSILRPLLRALDVLA